MKSFKGIIAVVILAIAMVALITACTSKKNNGPDLSNPDGIGRGKVNLTGLSPDADLEDIVASVGAEIDYTSQLEIKNEDKLENFEIWVKSATVDIYTPGEYTATYTFFWGDNEFSKDIKVYIVGDEIIETGESLTDKVTEETTVKDSSKENDVETDDPSTEKNDGEKDETTTKKDSGIQHESTTKKSDEDSKEQITKKPVATTQPTTTKKPVATTEPTTTKKPVATTKPTTTKKPVATTEATTTTKKPTVTTEPTTTKKYISSTDKGETTVTDLGYVYIELLSGSTVRVKTTSARYIVSTRTDVSIVTKKGYTYEVSKLIVTFSTGTEQVLETVEKRIG